MSVGGSTLVSVISPADATRAPEGHGRGPLARLTLADAKPTGRELTGRELAGPELAGLELTEMVATRIRAAVTGR